ncbi:MAG: Crp/Fnr family transcriptional regulator [Anaerolineales bacterium]|nr:Crp/Fnr family transcriptional regulator [Anaerolineales bacterium]
MIDDSSYEARCAARARRALRAVRHFGDLPEEAQAAVASAAALRRYAPEQVIYLEGEPPEALYILESGWVKATRMSPEGREQAMLFLQPGEVFGDIAVFTGVPYPGTVVALEPVEAWAIPRLKALHLVETHPQLAMAVIRRMGERVLHYVELVEDLSLRNVEARLANTLLKHMQEVNGRLVVPRRSWTTFDEMAVRLGTVRDVLSRALHTLEEEGYLRVERQAILILDIEGLAKRGNP